MKTYCISLADRQDKRTEVLPEFEKIGVKPIMFDAIKRKPGWQGCRDSHLKLLEQLRNETLFMICEDDVVFQNNAKAVIEMAFDELPKKWDMLYLGATLNKPLERYSESLYVLKGGWTTHAIIYNNFWVVDYILNKRDEINKIDVFFADDVQENFECFITYPLIALQRPGYSDIINNYTSYSIIPDTYKKFVK
jgi:GR25 family glycosyltransferase involved in LPS biosynthesis